MNDLCRLPASQQLLKGVRLFNTGEYYQCHEVLEELWLAERGPIRGLYQGVLQIGVALLHRERGNFKGAVSLLQSGLRHISPFAPACQQLDLARLSLETETLLVHLQELGAERLAEMDQTLVPQVWLRSDSLCDDELGGDDDSTQL